MGALSPTHWLIIAGVLLLLFGAKRLPDAARSLGRSARILKAEVHELNPLADSGSTPDAAAAAALPPARPVTTPPAVSHPVAAPAASTDGGELAAVRADQPGR